MNLNSPALSSMQHSEPKLKQSLPSAGISMAVSTPCVHCTLSSHLVLSRPNPYSHRHGPGAHCMCYGNSVPTRLR